MPKKVAITIAGAVSLGSYEAGVIYELLEAFRTYNQEAERKSQDKIYVDVLTGASAGGMTAAMLAQRLMFDGASLGTGVADACAFTNDLYRAWVERIDIRELVSMRGPEEKLKWHSLLSSDLIEKIGKEKLEDWLLPGPASLSGPHAAVELDANGKALPLDVGLALTNLNGIDYMLSIPAAVEKGFNYTSSVDQKLFKVTADDRLEAAKWADLRQAAVTCGAFPAAFRPQQIKRGSTEFGLPKRPKNDGDMKEGCTYLGWRYDDDPHGFAYCDGGVLQNQPLGIAKNFVDVRKQMAPEVAEDRLYVFVSPHAVLSTANSKLVADETKIGEELVALFHTYIRQATFHDWITAEGMNQKVRVLDCNAAELADALQGGAVPDVQALLTAALELNKWLIRDDDRRKNAIDRLKVEYVEEYTRVSGPDTPKSTVAAEAFVQAVLTLETAAQLGERDTMNIIAVIADGRTELAGSGISAFAGFFSKEFREHDYWMGRVKTRVYLQRSDVKKVLNVTEWPHEGRWGGASDEGVKLVLENPTSITRLPLTFGEMMKPGRKSLLAMVLIRPALLWSAVAAVAVGGFACAGAGCLAVWTIRHLRR